MCSRQSLPSSRSDSPSISPLPNDVPTLDFSAFPRRLREERAHQRPERRAPTVRAFVTSALALTDRQRQGDFLLALLAIELVVGHDRSSLMPPGQCPSAVTLPRGNILPPRCRDEGGASASGRPPPGLVELLRPPRPPRGFHVRG